jgi:hypothetical protein
MWAWTRRRSTLRAQCVSLDVPQHGQQVLVLLDRKRLEASLPDMPASAVMPMIASHVAGEQPLHPAPQIAVLSRPDNQVKMIRHHAIAQHAHRQPLARPRDQPDEGRVIIVFVEDLGPRVATIEHMITNAAHRSSSCARHGATVDAERPRVNAPSGTKVECPLFGNAFLAHGRRKVECPSFCPVSVSFLSQRDSRYKLAKNGRNRLEFPRPRVPVMRPRQPGRSMRLPFSRKAVAQRGREVR